MSTALIGRRLCGCVVSIDTDASPKRRERMEAKGYSVTEMACEEAIFLFNRAKDDCGHGDTTEQLAAEVKRLRAEVERLGLLLSPALPDLCAAETTESGMAFKCGQPKGHTCEHFDHEWAKGWV